ncbi:hypothetical protein AB0D45_02585 [Streptomyces sp. NPDC048352]|uniref:hypothetical protein n=1 Tax=Streptomyces sp. NPDC048352 TaxID=3154718 RepID=UPI00341F5FF0
MRNWAAGAAGAAAGASSTAGAGSSAAAGVSRTRSPALAMLAVGRSVPKYRTDTRNGNGPSPMRSSIRSAFAVTTSCACRVSSST